MCVAVLFTVVSLFVMPMDALALDNRDHPVASPHSAKHHIKVVDMEKFMMGMQASMSALPSSGNPDHDFALNMRLHHGTATDMARAELAFGNDPDMLATARKVLTSQKQGIDEFDRWLDEHENAVTEDERASTEREAARSMRQQIKTLMQKMMVDMETLPTTKDTDYNFAVNMRMHHQMAIDMSRLELDYGTDTEVRAKAQQIISMQQQEIAELDKWLEAHQPEETVKN
jgi:uncharacterized protein (DUF305 family)